MQGMEAEALVMGLVLVLLRKTRAFLWEKWEEE
jgi:hypothetical protein